MVTIEEGRVTFGDMVANQDRLLNDPDFDPEFNQLSDATLATDTDLSASNARTLYDRRVFSATARRAVVALAHLPTELHECSKPTLSYQETARSSQCFVTELQLWSGWVFLRICYAPRV